MTVFPLIAREARRQARNPATFWARSAVVLAATLVCLSGLVIFGPGATPADRGKNAFVSLTVVAMVLSCLAGLLAVTAICRERAAGTLGLLFLTRVRPSDVLLAGFGSEGFAAFCLLTAFAPVVFVPIVAGGVTGGEAARTTFVLYATLGLSLAVGFWAASSGRELVRSARSFLLLLAVILFAPELASHASPFFLLSPVGALSSAGDVAYGRWPGAYWGSLAFIVGGILCFLFSANRRLRRSFQTADEPLIVAVSHSAKAAAVRNASGSQRPFLWLFSRDPSVRTAIWLAALPYPCVEILTLLAFRFFGARSFARLSSYTWGVGLGLSWMRDLVFCWANTRFLVEGRRTGEIELLLTTPRGSKALLPALWQIQCRLFFWPAVVLVSPFVIDALLTLRWDVMGTSSLFIMVGMVGRALTVVATIWAAFWFGWTAKSQARAILMTFLVVTGVPFVCSRLLQIILPWNLVFRSFSVAFLNVFVLVPQVINIVYTALVIRWAARRVKAAFPESESLWHGLKPHAGRAGWIFSLLFKTE